MSQSPELAGGEGFTFEGDAAAYYMSALLAQAFAPGVDDRIVIGVSVQQRDFGEPLDDVIVDFLADSGSPARLSLQVKRSLIISDAASNEDFRAVIRDSWATLNKVGFRMNSDRYGVATGTVAAEPERSLKTLCDWARASIDVSHFDARFAPNGNAGAAVKAVKDDIVRLLEEVKGSACTNEEVHRFLAHFVIIRFDFLREGSTDPADAINRVKDCLVPEEAGKAPLVWARLVQLARSSAGKAGQFDRPRLVHTISTLARLRGAAAFGRDLDILTTLARSYTALIPDDVGGTRLDRTALLAKLDSMLLKARIVQIRGLPGSGKSAVVRRAVEHALTRGNVLFLKAEQLEGSSWIKFAAAHGLSSIGLEHLLVEIAATGTAVLYIDAIDRIEKEQQAVVLDLIRGIVESPLLNQWRVVVSLRDTGIEVLSTWLGDLLNRTTVDTLDVALLSDEEAETLATAKPHLRPLLFGSKQVQEIVRRPFFAKVLNQSHQANPSASSFVPTSEVDLIRNWWRGGGYDQARQPALERQLVLMDLARIRSRRLNQPVRLTELRSANRIDDLRADGILQDAREGVSVRFSHDIFFEWSFFHVLAERDDEWLDEVRACGEPPAIARVVELTAQWEYNQGDRWAVTLCDIEKAGLRSQWLRAWLLAPIGSAHFDARLDEFCAAVFADDFRLFGKLLVWYQADKTAPNLGILHGTLPEDQRQRMAYLLAWPSDFAAWQRLVTFILLKRDVIPVRLYPDVIAVFEVWQNATAAIPNPLSHALLTQCADWVASIDSNAHADAPDPSAARWLHLPDLGDFRESAVRMFLMAAKSEPGLASAYLRRLTDDANLQANRYQEAVSLSQVLAQAIPDSLVDLSLAYYREELPDVRVAREHERVRRAVELRAAILAKPEAERTADEEELLSPAFYSLSFDDVGDFEWDNLGLKDDRASSPSSPLREPFQALFRFAPGEALRLLRELCNHATSGWRQAHKYSRKLQGTPLPLALDFPWGTQHFWGGDREYLWFRSTGAPDIIGSGFLALEEWCFAEMARGRAIDDLIHQIVEGNESIAILGAAGVIALQSQAITPVTLPILTSQRLLHADTQRWAQDLSPSTSLIGFMSPSDVNHAKAVRAMGTRPVRKLRLESLLPLAVLHRGGIAGKARMAIAAFEDNLPFQYEEQRGSPEVQAHLIGQALKYAEFASIENYQASHSDEHPGKVVISHHSPSAAQPENVARANEASAFLQQSGVFAWASRSLESRLIGKGTTIDAAIELIRSQDISELFQFGKEQPSHELAMKRGAASATAAVVLVFRAGRQGSELQWARDILRRAICLPESTDSGLVSSVVVPWHQAIFVARGLGADLRAGTADETSAVELLCLIAHPLDVVSATALTEVVSLWTADAKLAWAAVYLALTLCHVPDHQRHVAGTLQLTGKAEHAFEAALAFYRTGTGWAALPLPPPAWVKYDPENDTRPRFRNRTSTRLGSIDKDPEWVPSPQFWSKDEAAKVLQVIPLEQVFESGAKLVLIAFVAGVLDWTIQQYEPAWRRTGTRHDEPRKMHEWNEALGSCIGRLAGLTSLDDIQDRLLSPILALRGDNCWSLLSPFVDIYVRAHVYDAPTVPTDALPILTQCLDRFLQDASFKKDSHYAGKFSGFDQPALARTLMFISVEEANRASRYVNGDWSDIGRILPLVDRYIRAGGWAAVVMGMFLTLCERSRSAYPAEAFGDQILNTIVGCADSLTGWRGTMLPARIAGLVHHLAHRDAPMNLALGQKFLQILDVLVDMGDRRSAALQHSEEFRVLRLRS